MNTYDEKVFSIIDRYIAKRFLLFFFSGLLVLVTFFLAVDSMSKLVQFSVSGQVFLRYYFYLAPSVIYQMIPIAALIGTVFTLGTMNRNNELIALFSSGVSLLRISAPILVLVGLISLLSFYASDRILPVFAQKRNYVYYVEIKNKPGLYSTVKTDRIWYRSQDILYNIKTLIPEKNLAQGLTMYYFNQSWDLIQMLTARSVELKGNNWLLKEGSITLFTEDSSFPLTQNFNTKTIIMLEDSKDLQSTAQTAEVLNLNELKKYIQRNKEAGLETVHYEVDFHSKYGFVFTAFVMAFLGIPFSVGRLRSGNMIVGVGICMAMAFMYWTLYSSAITLGHHGQIPPIIAAWVPNFIMLAISFGLVRQLKR